MALGKIFQMGGLFKGPNRQAEPASGWRRLLNVWQDRTGKFRPKGEQATFFTPTSPYTIGSGAILRAGFVRRFQDGLFSAWTVNYGTPAVNYKNFFQYTDKTGTNITPTYNSSTGSLTPDTEELAFGRNTFPNVVVGNKLFFKSGSLPLQKFDGVQILRAGIPLPYINCPEYDGTTTYWAKIVDVRIGFDGTLVSSGVVKFPVNNSSITINMSYNTGAEIVGQPLVTPTFRDSPACANILLDDMAWFVKGFGTAWTSAGTGSSATLTVTTAGQNLVAGQWVMFHDLFTGGLSNYIYALQVSNIFGFSVTFNANAKVYSKANLSWGTQLFTASDAPFNSTQAQYWTSFYRLVYGCATENGAFLWSINGALPLYGREQTGYSWGTLDLSFPMPSGISFGGQTTRDIQGWYDIGTVKLPFPYASKGDQNPGILGMTKYQGLLLTYDKNAVYFSDTSAGGSDEMISGLSNFVPLGSEYGAIVCVEGCEDFVFISRQRKNFVLIGDIATGNFTINECDTEPAGAFSSTAACAVNGGVAYVTRQGIFFCSASGTITEASAALSRLFGTSREFVTDPDAVTFQPYLMSDVGASPTYWDGNLVKMKYDSDRNILAILYGHRAALLTSDAADRYSILAINLKNGNMYEWKTNQVSSLDIVVTDVEFLESYSSLGKFQGSLIQAGKLITRENNTATRVSDQYMISSWLVGDEPSLEKQAKQVKFYGQMTSCRIFHQENWEPFTSIAAIVSPKTNVVWPTSGNQNTNLFEHKQRLNTASPQAISIGFEPLDLNFSFEGYEIEWDLRQESTKK